MIFIADMGITGQTKKIKSIPHDKVTIFALLAKINGRFTKQKAAAETGVQRMIDFKKHHHKMTLFNHDLLVNWHFENDFIKITDVNILYNSDHNLIRFISGKVFKLIVEDIENSELMRKWM
jgi:hypothetical protein